MKVFFISLAVAMAGLLSACTAPSTQESSLGRNEPASVAGGAASGSGFASAIVVHAKNEESGVRAEYDWIRANLPGFRPEGQSLVSHGGKPYDIIVVVAKSGEKREVYFDISEFFGKLQ